MSDAKILETFPNPAPHRDYVIEHTHHEFTSMCPITGHPDFAAIMVRYGVNSSNLSSVVYGASAWSRWS